jgi:hypothetical protein
LKEPCYHFKIDCCKLINRKYKGNTKKIPVADTITATDTTHQQNSKKDSKTTGEE